MPHQSRAKGATLQIGEEHSLAKKCEGWNKGRHETAGEGTLRGNTRGRATRAGIGRVKTGQANQGSCAASIEHTREDRTSEETIPGSQNRKQHAGPERGSEKEAKLQALESEQKELGGATGARTEARAKTAPSNPRA